MPEAGAPLRGRAALVTGAGRGIGRGIALELAASGAGVVVNYRRDEGAAREVVEEIEAGGGEAIAVQASVADAEQVEALADAALERFGTVDILVSNAGLASRGETVAETDPAEFLRLIETNVLGLQRLLRRLLPAMRSAARGDVVAISSSEVDAMRARGGPYNVAKAGLEALAMTLAKEELANGIRVNVVAPGLVVTAMGARAVKAKLGIDDISELDPAQPLGRLVRPQDIADAVRFLVSERAAMVSGQRIVVEGGTDTSPTR